MAKGVKKIKYESGPIHADMGSPGGLVITKPGNSVWFVVSDWLPGTTAEDKKKQIVWMRQTKDRRTVLSQMTIPHNYKYGIKISKRLCGSFSYYVEASLSGKRDPGFSGLYVRGHCEPKIVSSKWTAKKGGPKMTGYVKYGSVVHLNLVTEGLNGNKLIIELFNSVTLALKDKRLKVYTNVECISGEVNLEFQDLYSWMTLVENIKNMEDFYVKVKDVESGKYIKDATGKDKHAMYLTIKNEVITTNVNRTKNNKPVVVGTPKINTQRYEPCKFSKIQVTEVVKDKTTGKAKPETVTIFEEGKRKIVNTSKGNESVSRSVFFDFDQFNIRPDAQGVLSNILQFLLEHQGSIIHLDAHADDRGTDAYNQVLSQKRADQIKKFLVSGGLDGSRIIPVGHGESQLKVKGAHLTESQHQLNRRAEISFKFDGHEGSSIIFETIGPTVSTKRNLVMVIGGYETKKCFTRKHVDKKVILKNIGQQLDSGDKEVVRPVGDSNTVNQDIYSDLSRFSVGPIQYIWPRATTPNSFWYYINTCRYYTNPVRPTVTVKVYPDVEWTLEFKWNHTSPFAYSYGTKMHPHNIKTGQEKAIEAAVDSGWNSSQKEMSQSFNLALEATWDEKSQKAELQKTFGERIAGTLKIFNKMKEISDKIVKSPVNGGKISFEIKAPVIAFSAKWSLERPSPESLEIGTSVEFGIESKPLLEIEGRVDIWKVFLEMGPDFICPGAGKVLAFIMKHLKGNLEIKFEVVFTGGINVSGKVKGNTLALKDSKGTIKVTGKVSVALEFKARAKGDIGSAGFEGVLKADVDTSVTGGYKAEIDKHGICGSPVFEFGGITAKYAAVGTLKWGWFERVFTADGAHIIVDPYTGTFEKKYILGPYN